MKRTTGQSEAVRKTSRSVATQRRAAKTQPSSSNLQTNANTIDQGKAMNDEEMVMSAEDNGDAWAHQLELEREQQEVEKATADKWQDNYFVQLAKIDVSEHVEKKGGFSYL
ncbi:MAG: hypothetical protein M3120_07320, partial [Pseudomonadota bacterium]|nr:hypothetical protein [Pseudomonadota bacterium]